MTMPPLSSPGRPPQPSLRFGNQGDAPLKTLGDRFIDLEKDANPFQVVDFLAHLVSNGPKTFEQLTTGRGISQTGLETLKQTLDNLAGTGYVQIAANQAYTVSNMGLSALKTTYPKLKDLVRPPDYRHWQTLP